MEGDEQALSGASIDSRVAALLENRRQLTDELAEAPYDIVLYLSRAVVYADLAYPDLAAGDAYRALLLTDEISDESFEYHIQALESLSPYAGRGSLPDVLRYGSLTEAAPAEKVEIEDDATGTERNAISAASSSPLDLESCQKLAAVAAIRCYQILSLNLLLCGCLRSAHKFCERGLAAAPDNNNLQEIKGYIDTVARSRLRRRRLSNRDGKRDEDGFNYNPADLPDRGVARREVYPWNTYEPDRFSAESLAFLNDEVSRAAPKCEVRATELPILVELDESRITKTEGSENSEKSLDSGITAIPTCRQLGIFAKEPIAAGEVVLREYSLLTANNRLKESACDACGTELPELADIGKSSRNSDGPVATPVSCPDCYDTVFCDEFCFEQAQEKYHPAVCKKDVDAIAKDPDDARDADDALYVLLLARLLAMATHQECHPLDVNDVKYIWGDFSPSQSNDVDLSPKEESPPLAWTLPFSFEANIATPLHILEKMDLDVFADLALYDVWVCNTLYAKFRGTASARKSRRDGRPDVAAVHPLWCLANHDCDPNVTWEWGGRMVLWAREERINLAGQEKRPGGISAGQEILNHYCDVDLPVQLRREWASGSLGGCCMCQRCRNEVAAEAEDAS